jgi:glutamate/aspartate transport system substrate-binding protein
MIRGLIVVLSVALSAAASAQQAAPKPSRLERIAATGQFVIGHRETAVPFAYFDQAQRPVGYGVDIARRVFEAVKAQLGKPGLNLRFNAVTATTLSPLIETKVVDIECGVTTNTPERAQHVAFSSTIYVDAVRIAVPANSDVAKFGDLAGKRVAVVADSKAETLVKRLAAEHKVALEQIPVLNELRGVQALEDRRVDALIAAAALSLGQISRSADPKHFKVVGDALQLESYACVLPKGDPTYKRLVDATLAELMRSGAMAKLHAKWFQAPIPPYRWALNLPLNDATRAAFASPSDPPAQ